MVLRVGAGGYTGAPYQEVPVDASRWVEELSTDADSDRIRRHLDRVIATMIHAAARRQGDEDVLRILASQQGHEPLPTPAKSLASPPPAGAAGRGTFGHDQRSRGHHFR